MAKRPGAGLVRRRAGTRDAGVESRNGNRGNLAAAKKSRSGADPVELAIFKNALHSIAEEMGAALRRTAFSPNIKERRDYSSALFDAEGRVIAMGDDMPVHLGSMPMSVEATLRSLSFDRGDIAILNDPFAGG